MADQAGFTNSQASAQGRLQPHSSATESAKPCAWFGLQGKLALVTGASSGLGARFASVLAEQGCRLLLAARRVDRLQALAEQLRSEGAEVQVLAMDVTSLASIQAAIEQAHAQAGPIDILINNSGVSTTQRLTEVTESDYDYIFNTNTRGAFFVAQTVAKSMIERAKQATSFETMPASRIINIASMAGLEVLSMIGVYCMSKAAVVHMTRAMALEWGRYNINVNAICPGYILTEINQAHFESDAGQKLISRLPRRRIGKPEDLDAVLLMLASGRSGFVNGAVISADDGPT
ncbi:MAG: SDR family oxidoreductase [Betaproteobacteria bacterium]|nr:SDR family oxidoreductase [Betaproteobacteria bacterium]